MSEKNAFIHLYSLILPSGVVKEFNIVRVEETDSMIHIFLDEKPTPPVHPIYTYQSQGFTDETKVTDFPIRGRAVLLHIRRRKWLEVQTKRVITTKLNIKLDGTQLSSEFAAFLKDAYRG